MYVVAVYETEEMLIRDAALTLSMHGGNQRLCQALGQCSTPPTIQLDSLTALGLPNPALALCSKEFLAENLRLIDLQFASQPGAPERRLICAIDGTYLLRTYSQIRLRGEDGLVGGPWSPTDFQDDTPAFIKFDALDRKKGEKAPMMLQSLVWDPNSKRRKVLPLAAMPMRLGPQKNPSQTLTRSGQWEMLRVVGLILENGCSLIKGITFDAHNSHLFFREAMLGEFEKISQMEIVEQQIPFFKDMVYEGLPAHCLPRLPLKIAKHGGSSIWALQGPCPLTEMWQCPWFCVWLE